MFKFLFSFLLISSTLSFHNPWQEYISQKGNYKVSIPGTMKEVINTVPTSLGELKYHIAVFRDSDKDADNLMYMISFCDYPQGSIHSDSIDLVQEFLEASIEQSVASVNGSLSYSTDITIKGYPGKMWRTDFGEGQGIIRTKAFVMNHRFYSIQTSCLKEKSLNTSSDKFFDSFSLLQEEEKLIPSKKKKRKKK